MGDSNTEQTAPRDDRDSESPQPRPQGEEAVGAAEPRPPVEPRPPRGPRPARGPRPPSDPGEGRAPRDDGEQPARPVHTEAVEPRDEREARALGFLSEVLDKMHMECSVELLPPDPDDPSEISLEISGRDAARIIGKKGQVLAALQLLVNRAVNRPSLERRFVSVDAEGYRSRRDSSLASMAQRLGQQAIELGKIITFEPMPPRDRRVVHLALAKLEGVVTKSEGEGEDRRVQIIPVRR